MAQKDTNLTVCLHLVEGLLEPLELVARVISELHEEEVSIVAGFGVDSDNSNLVILSAIGSLELLGVEAIDSELCLGIWSEPVSPETKLISDHRVRSGRTEVLRVNRHTEVVVALKRVGRPVKVLVHVVREELGVPLSVLQ